MYRLNPKTLLRISRPRFWLYLLGPYLIGLVAGAPHLSGLWDWRTLIYLLYFLLPANLLAYGTNDIFDYETDRLNEKKQEYEQLVSPNLYISLSRWIVLTNIPFILLLLATNVWAAGVFLLFLFLAVFYSAPPIRAKTKPVLDSLFNALYMLPGLFGYYLAGGTDALWTVIVASILWCMAMHAYSAVPDIEADKAAGLHTIATLFGRKITLILCFGLYMAAAILGAFVFGNLSRIVGVIYAVLMVLSLQQQHSRDIFLIYRWFPLVNTLMGTTLFLATLIWRIQGVG